MGSRERITGKALAWFNSEYLTRAVETGAAKDDPSLTGAVAGGLANVMAIGMGLRWEELAALKLAKRELVPALVYAGMAFAVETWDRDIRLPSKQIVILQQLAELARERSPKAAEYLGDSDWSGIT